MLQFGPILHPYRLLRAFLSNSDPNMKKKLIFVIGSLQLGGAERHLVSLLPLLKSRGWSVQLLTLTERGLLAPDLEKMGIPVYCALNAWHLKENRYLPNFVKRLLRIISCVFGLTLKIRKEKNAHLHFFLPEAYVLGMISATLARFPGHKIMSRRSLNHYQQRRPMVAWLESKLHAKTTMITGNCIFCKKVFRKREQKYKFCSLTCASRYNLNGLKNVKLPRKSKDLAEFVGILLGDGDLTRYQVSVTLNSIVDHDYIDFVLKLMQKLFPETSPKIKEKEHCTVVYLSSRLVVDFLKKMQIMSGKPYVPEWIFTKKQYTIACIRGLVDTEGSVGFKVYNKRKYPTIYRQLAFTSRNPVLLRFVSDELYKLNFKCTRSLIKNIYLSNDVEIDKYRSIIGFHNPKLEQRSLLRDYQSYKNWRGV